MLKVDRTTASRAIKKLEIQGLIEKKHDQANKKINRLYATEKGNEVYPALKREGEHSNKVALSGLLSEEIETLYILLQKVRKNVELDWEFVKKGNKREN